MGPERDVLKESIVLAALWMEIVNYRQRGELHHTWLRARIGDRQEERVRGAQVVGGECGVICTVCQQTDIKVTPVLKWR